MKIVCESCGAKYSIADEKVAGKVFKIRCKRCSEVIVVRGDQSEGEQASAGPSTPAASDEAVWHVVINGEQQGPYSPPQLADMLSAGTIDWEAFVWTEGFDNWVALRNVDELVAKVSGSTQAPVPDEALQATTAAGGFGVQSAPEDFAGEPSMGADPFADEESSREEPESQELFAEAAPAAVAPLTGGGASGSPRVSAAEAKLTGARNENSVLFSLKNLQALATGADESPAGAPPVGTPAGFASGEGSGLIDIRALASATNTPRPSGDNDESTKDELLSLAGQGSAFGGLGSPMMAPPPEEPSSSNKSMVYASIIGAGVLVAAAVVLVGFLNRPEPQTAAAALPVAPATTAAAAPGVAAERPAAMAEEAEPEEPSEGELAAREAAAAAESDAPDDEDDDTRANAGPGRRKAQAAARRKAARRAETAAAPEPSAPKAAAKTETAAAPAPRRKASANSTIDDLLDGALGGGGSKRAAKKAAPAPAASNLPEKPSRDEVMAAMNGVKSAVSACAKGASGVAFANVTVSGSTGRVSNATIEGQTGEVGSCIARAVRKAKFPRFSSSTFKVKFPFRL